MENVEDILERLFSYYKVASVAELSKQINTSQKTISNWKIRNSISAVKKKCRELGIYNEIFGDINPINETNENQTYKLFDLAFEVSKEKNNVDELENTIANFLALNIIKDKFQNMNKEMTFYNYILSGYKKRISNIILLSKVLSNSKIDVTIENAKEKLLELINSYKIELLKDKILHGLNNESKDNLENWIDMNIDDIEAFVILKNIPIILKYLTENINYLNKLDLKILQLKNGG